MLPMAAKNLVPRTLRDFARIRFRQFTAWKRLTRAIEQQERESQQESSQLLRGHPTSFMSVHKISMTKFLIDSSGPGSSVIY